MVFTFLEILLFINIFMECKNDWQFQGGSESVCVLIAWPLFGNVWPGLLTGRKFIYLNLSKYRQIEQCEPRWHSLLMVARLGSCHTHFIHPVLVGVWPLGVYTGDIYFCITYFYVSNSLFAFRVFFFSTYFTELGLLLLELA